MYWIVFHFTRFLPLHSSTDKQYQYQCLDLLGLGLRLVGLDLRLAGLDLRLVGLDSVTSSFTPVSQLQWTSDKMKKL